MDVGLSIFSYLYVFGMYLILGLLIFFSTAIVIFLVWTGIKFSLGLAHKTKPKSR